MPKVRMEATYTRHVHFTVDCESSEVMAFAAMIEKGLQPDNDGVIHRRRLTVTTIAGLPRRVWENWARERRNDTPATAEEKNDVSTG